MEQLNTYSDYVINGVMHYGPKVLLALVTLVIGLYLIRGADKLLSRALTKRNIEPSLKSFLSSVMSAALKVLLLISVAQMIGIAMTAFVTVLGAIGLAVGLALSGTLQNFAGGVILLLIKPFKVGDFIEAQGFMGTVHEIQIFNTILKTPDNKTVIIPNSPLSTGALTNYSVERRRRIEQVYGISYSDDMARAKQIISEQLSKDERVFADPEPFIGINQLADSSVNIMIRYWCASDDFLRLQCDMLENIKRAFDEQGITIPFPQRDVHVTQQTPSS